MRFHWLRLRATAHATEDPERVRAAMRHLTGLDAAAFDALTEETQVEAHHGGDVRFLETTVSRSADVRRIVKELVDATPTLADELEARTDDDGILYLRFGKQDAYQGRTVATRSDDAVQVRIKPMVHPASRQGAIDAIAEVLATGRV